VKLPDTHGKASTPHTHKIKGESRHKDKISIRNLELESQAEMFLTIKIKRHRKSEVYNFSMTFSNCIGCTVSQEHVSVSFFQQHIMSWE